jgi:hypothetical protein
LLCRNRNLLSLITTARAEAACVQFAVSIMEFKSIRVSEAPRILIIPSLFRGQITFFSISFGRTLVKKDLLYYEAYLGTCITLLAILSTFAQMAPCGTEETYTYNILSNTTAIRPGDTIYIDLWIHFLVSSLAKQTLSLTVLAFISSLYTLTATTPYMASNLY